VPDTDVLVASRTTTPADGDADPRLVEALERIIVAGVAMTNAALSQARPGLDLSFPQWRVLVVLGDRPDGLSVRDVSRLIDVTLPATGRQLRRLEHRGLVVLEPDRRDRRVTRARLTESGLIARDSIVRQRRDRISASVAGIEMKPSAVIDLESMAASLERPVANET